MVLLLLYALKKKVPAYSGFVQGAKDALNLCASVFPYIAAVFIGVQLFKASGLSAILAQFMSPVFSLLGIPKELCELILIRPFSGNASLALLADIYTDYGVDSYVAKCASVIISSSDTVFYISAVYFAGTKVSRFKFAIPVALASNLLAAVAACILVRFF